MTKEYSPEDMDLLRRKIKSEKIIMDGLQRIIDQLHGSDFHVPHHYIKSIRSIDEYHTRHWRRYQDQLRQAEKQDEQRPNIPEF